MSAVWLYSILMLQANIFSVTVLLVICVGGYVFYSSTPLKSKISGWWYDRLEEEQYVGVCVIGGSKAHTAYVCSQGKRNVKLQQLLILSIYTWEKRAVPLKFSICCPLYILAEQAMSWYCVLKIDSFLYSINIWAIFQCWDSVESAWLIIVL